MINNYVRDVSGRSVLGGSFSTIIGVIFLVIVIVSPGGLMGLWDRRGAVPGLQRRYGGPVARSVQRRLT